VTSTLDEVWESAASDPDPHHDLGYELGRLEVVELGDEGTQYMFLPTERELVRDEAFIIADPGSICRLEECR